MAMVQRNKTLIATAIAAGVPVTAFLAKNEKMLPAMRAAFGVFGIRAPAFGTNNLRIGFRTGR